MACSSLIRATDANESVLAAEERRKCWAIGSVSGIKLSDTISHSVLLYSKKLSFMVTFYRMRGVI